MGVYDDTRDGFVMLDRRNGEIVFTRSAKLSGTPVRITRRSLNVLTEIGEFLWNRCADCREELYPVDGRWVHEDGTPPCGPRVSFPNLRLREYLQGLERDVVFTSTPEMPSM